MQSVLEMRRRIRTPQADGQALIEPPLREVAGMLRRNALLLQSSECELAGRRLAEAARSARSEFLAAAADHTRRYRDLPDALVRPVADLARSPILVAGHQPSLFHPGVWFKNFALSRLAAEHGAVGVNLQIDSDTVQSTAIRVPTGDAARPLVRSISLDEPTAEVPFEERSIQNVELFASFGERATAAIRNLVPRPLVESWWPSVVELADGRRNLGQVIAQARHELEAQWGLHTLEIPQSSVCRLEAFGWFVAHMVARPDRTQEIYNTALADYRRANRIRSRSHPVPNLAATDDWFETPFWIWSNSDPKRRGLFARRRNRGVVLSNLAGWEVSLGPYGDFRGSGDLDGAAAAGQIRELAAAGVKIRTRAITTTMFARLLLGDLFLHGIGGAKYDELTDLLIARLFDLAAPGYMVLSATVRLPVADWAAGPPPSRRLAERLRELEFHPERYVDRELARRRGELEPLESAVASKRAWIEMAPLDGDQKARHRGIAAANLALQRWIGPARAALLAQQTESAAFESRAAVLGSREYAFCLHPAERLRSLLLELSTDSA
jgi:hypothetical protein